MDGFELNKIFAAILVALLIGMGSGMIGDVLIHPKTIEKNAFPVEGAEVVQLEEGGTGKDSGEIPHIEPLLAKADVEAGKIVAKKCLQCHTFEKGAPHKIGPNLWNILHSKIGHVSGYPYSESLKSTNGSWDVETINKFVHKPRDVIKGTKMTFPGLKKEKERADLIAYLKTLS